MWNATTNSTRVATFLATVIAKFHARKPVVYHDRRVGIGPGALVDQAARAQGEGLRRAIIQNFQYLKIVGRASVISNSKDQCGWPTAGR